MMVLQVLVGLPDGYYQIRTFKTNHCAALGRNAHRMSVDRDVYVDHCYFDNHSI